MGLLNQFPFMVKSNRALGNRGEEVMDYIVRPMHDGDIPQVQEIDREAFPTQWPPPSFKKDLNNGVIRYLVAYNENGDTCRQTETMEPEAEVNLPGLRVYSIK
jgi:hypothetical protein